MQKSYDEREIKRGREGLRVSLSFINRPPRNKYSKNSLIVRITPSYLWGICFYDQTALNRPIAKIRSNLNMTCGRQKNIQTIAA